MANNAYTEVAAPAAYAGNPSLAAGFTPDYWIFVPVSGGDAYYSYDGVSDHGRIKASLTAAMIIESKAERIWLKQVSGAATVGVSAATRI